MSDQPRRSISMPAEHWAALDEIAKREDRSVASLVRLAVGSYIDEHGVVNGLSGSTRRNLRRLHQAYGGDGNIPGLDTAHGEGEQ